MAGRRIDIDERTGRFDWAGVGDHGGPMQQGSDDDHGGIGRAARTRWLALGLAALLQVFSFDAHAETTPKTFPSLPVGIAPSALPDWLLAHTDIPPLSVVFLANGVVLILSDAGVPTGAGQRAVVIRREALGDAAATLIGGRSNLMRLQIDCAASQFRVLGAEVYAGNGLSGSIKRFGPNPTTMTAPPNTDMAFLQRAVCDPGYTPPLAVFPADTKPRSHAEPAAPAPIPKPANPASAFAAQVAASSSKAQAQAVLADLARLYPDAAGMPTRVETVQAGDRVLFRASIAGFETRARAEAFCVQLRSAGRPCWVR